jgi:hypothetical protein
MKDFLLSDNFVWCFLIAATLVAVSAIVKFNCDVEIAHVRAGLHLVQETHNTFQWVR